MDISLKHRFQSGIVDSSAPADNTKVKPSHWNAEHDLILSESGFLIGRSTAGAGAAEGIPIASFATAAQGAKADSAREVLTANRTYYVRSDGSDSNNGLSNASGGAFLTIQKAIDVAAALDASIYDVTIQLGDTGPFVGGYLKAPLGAGTLNIVGDPANPSNYPITKQGVWCFSSLTAGKFKLSGLKLNDAASNGLVSGGSIGATITLDNIDYGASTNFAIVSDKAAVILSGANNKISAASLYAFFSSQSLGQIFTSSSPTFTLLNNLTISNAFMLARWMGQAFMPTVTFALASYSVTGKRYNLTDNSAVITGGGGSSYFPGSVAGTSDASSSYS